MFWPIFKKAFCRKVLSRFFLNKTLNFDERHFMLKSFSRKRSKGFLLWFMKYSSRAIFLSFHKYPDFNLQETMTTLSCYKTIDLETKLNQNSPHMTLITSSIAKIAKPFRSHPKQGFVTDSVCVFVTNVANTCLVIFSFI